MLRRSLVAAFGFGLFASLAVLALRWPVEARYQTTEIVLDGLDWEALAVREGRDPAAFLAEAHRHGATSIAVYERTLKRLAESGEIAYLSGEEIASQARAGSIGGAFGRALAAGELRPRAVYVAATPELAGWLEDTIRGLLGPSRVRRAGPLVEIAGLRSDLEELGLGYLAPDLSRYHALGLVPVLRLRNYAGLTTEGLRSKISRLARLGRGYTVVFELTEVLGYDRLIPETAEALKAAGYRYGRIEVFSVKRKQRGEDQLGHLLRPDVIRLFSLTPEELQVLAPEEALGKFVRGARERNIRLLYVRPLVTGAGVVATHANLALIDRMTADLRRFGLHPGRAEPLPDVSAPLFLLLAVSLGALAAMALALLMLGDAVGITVRPVILWALLGLGLFLTAALGVTGTFTLWRKLLALGTAAAVPALGIAAALPQRALTPAGSQRSVNQILGSGARVLWIASAVSVAGGVLVAALLTRWEFMVAADVFLGVKLAHVIPVFLAVVFVWGRSREPKDWRDTAREVWAWSGHALLLRYGIAVAIAGLAAVVLLGRSGNFGLPVPEIEERLRNLMETLLVARPRTKEYLLGHPALFLAGAAAAAGLRSWVLPLVAVGAIGQAGIVNSFSHLHTPLVYTVWRTANALLLGTVLGGAATAVIATVVFRSRRSRRGR